MCHISCALACTSVARHVDLGRGGGRIDGGLTELALDRVLLSLAQACADILRQLRQGVVAAGLDRQLVVELGQALLLDLLDGHVEGRLLAGQVVGLVVVGEGDLHLAARPRGGSLQLLLEAGDQPTGAQLEQESARVAALEGLAVDRADEVDDHVVVACRSAVHGLQRGEGLAQPVELRVHVLLGHLGLAAPGLDALVAAQLGPRADAHLEAELERSALLGQPADIEVWAAHRGDARLVERVLVPAGERASHGLVEHRLATHLLKDDLGGTLPLRNPGTRMSRPSSPAAPVISRSMASGSTSTSTRTRESASSSVCVFTAATVGGR